MQANFPSELVHKWSLCYEDAYDCLGVPVVVDVTNSIPELLQRDCIDICVDHLEARDVHELYKILASDDREKIKRVTKGLWNASFTNDLRTIWILPH
jgi:hypothetical protein